MAEEMQTQSTKKGGAIGIIIAIIAIIVILIVVLQISKKKQESVPVEEGTATESVEGIVPEVPTGVENELNVIEQEIPAPVEE